MIIRSQNFLRLSGLLLFLLSSSTIFPDSTTTTLTNPEHIKIFNEVTAKIRCICLPSLPIKSCSFNNCRVSAYLKNFFENRIRNNESAESIVKKTVNGFGEEILTDPVIVMFLNEGNRDIVDGLVNGFGERILATPDSKSINLTLIGAIICGLSLIVIYVRKKRNSPNAQNIITANSDKEKYLREVEE
ncbi:MAG: cytochrome C biogenesis protein [Leptospiraceae bacterium]|nr:cytochrome C biogenesis protein [Leptospiraceae bacterium]